MQTNIPSNLQADIEKVRPAPDKYNTRYYIEAINFNLSNKDNHLWNDMINVLNTNFAKVKLNNDLNWIIKLSQKQIRTSAKENSIRWCQQCNKPGAIGRIESDLLKGYELAPVPVTWNKSHQLNIQTKNTYKRNNANIACQLLRQSRW